MGFGIDLLTEGFDCIKFGDYCQTEISRRSLTFKLVLLFQRCDVDIVLLLFAQIITIIFNRLLDKKIDGTFSKEVLKNLSISHTYRLEFNIKVAIT